MHSITIPRNRFGSRYSNFPGSIIAAIQKRSIKHANMAGSRAGAQAGAIPEGNLSLKDIIQAIQSKNPGDVVEKLTGQQLNADNFQDTTAALQQKLLDSTASRDQGCGSLNKREELLLESLNAAIAKGEIPAKSGLGNKFRSDVDQQSFKTLKHLEAKEFRMKWAKDLKDKLLAKKYQRKTWKRIDMTNFV